jgi:hypothetical protein
MQAARPWLDSSEPAALALAERYVWLHVTPRSPSLGRAARPVSTRGWSQVDVEATSEQAHHWELDSETGNPLALPPPPSPGTLRQAIADAQAALVGIRAGRRRGLPWAAGATAPPSPAGHGPSPSLPVALLAPPLPPPPRHQEGDQASTTDPAATSSLLSSGPRASGPAPAAAAEVEGQGQGQRQGDHWHVERSVALDFVTPRAMPRAHPGGLLRPVGIMQRAVRAWLTRRHCRRAVETARAARIRDSVRAAKQRRAVLVAAAGALAGLCARGDAWVVQVGPRAECVLNGARVWCSGPEGSGSIRVGLCVGGGGCESPVRRGWEVVASPVTPTAFSLASLSLPLPLPSAGSTAGWL